MKTFKFTFLALLVLCAVSCQKSTTSTDSSAVVTQAVDVAASSMAGNSFGFVSITDNMAANAQTLNSVGSQSVNSVGANAVHQACGSTLADSISTSGSSNSVTYSYFAKYTRTLNCNTNSQPDNLVNTLTFHGNFDGPRLTSSDSGTAQFTIAGLTTNATSWVVNGEYKRAGSFTSKVGDKTTGTSNIDIKATNLTLTKPTGHIAGGTGVIGISVVTSKGTYSFNGTVVFNGDGTANLTVNNTVYVVDLVTGTYTKK
jgi:hypothetical protein